MRIGLSQRFLRPVRIAVGLACGVGWACGAVASDPDRMQSLLDRPPFKARNEGVAIPESLIPTQGAINQRFEFTGIYESSGNVKVSIRDSESGRGYWLSPGQSIEGFRLESYEPVRRSVVISQSGRMEMLKLKEIQPYTGSPAFDPQVLNPNRFQLPNRPGLPSVSPNRGAPSVPPKMPMPPSMVDQLRKTKKPN